MGVYIDAKNLIIITEPIRFDLSKKVDNSLKHEINSIIKHNEFLAEHVIKKDVTR